MKVKLKSELLPQWHIHHLQADDVGEVYHDPDVEEMIYQNFIEDYFISPRCFTIYRNFFERYHDDDPECVSIFNEYMRNFII